MNVPFVFPMNPPWIHHEFSQVKELRILAAKKCVPLTQSLGVSSVGAVFWPLVSTKNGWELWELWELWMFIPPKYDNIGFDPQNVIILDFARKNLGPIRFQEMVHFRHVWSLSITFRPNPPGFSLGFHKDLHGRWEERPVGVLGMPRFANNWRCPKHSKTRGIIRPGGFFKAWFCDLFRTKLWWIH